MWSCRRRAPGGGKSHLAAAIGLALVGNGWKVLFTRTTGLVQKLQVARLQLALEVALNHLDRFDLLIPNDLAYAPKDQAETNVLFQLIGAPLRGFGLDRASHPMPRGGRSGRRS